MKKIIFIVTILVFNTTFSQSKVVSESLDKIKLIFTAESKDENIKKTQERLKNDNNVDLEVKNVTRNKDGKITGLEISFNDNNGNSGSKKIKGTEPIKPISFSYFKDSNGDVNTSLGIEDSVKKKYEISDIRFTEDNTTSDDDNVTKPKSYSKSIKIITDENGNIKKSVTENGKEIEEEILKITESLGEKFNFDLDLEKLMQGKSFNFSFENLDKLKDNFPNMEKIQEDMKKMKEEMEKMKTEIENSKKELKNTKKI